MKKLFTILVASLVFAAGLSAEEEKEMKTGWSFGVLPTATYSVDNGFQAGAFGDVYYYGDGSTLRWGGAKTGSVGAKAGILSLGVTKDYILVGTSSGITHHPLTAEGVPGSRASNMPYNAEATLSAQYNILSILVVNPEKNETETAIYASQNYTGNGSNSAQFDHICMWAYYPERHEWNRD